MPGSSGSKLLGNKLKFIIGVGGTTKRASRVKMDLLGSILKTMDKPPTASEREKKAAKGGD